MKWAHDGLSRILDLGLLKSEDMTTATSGKLLKLSTSCSGIGTTEFAISSIVANLENYFKSNQFQVHVLSSIEMDPRCQEEPIYAHSGDENYCLFDNQLHFLPDSIQKDIIKDKIDNNTRSRLKGLIPKCKY